MNKARQCIIKAAALRAQADKLEKVAALVGRDADSGSGSTSTATKVGIGLGAGALGLAAGGALGLPVGAALGFGKGGALAFRLRDLQRAADLKAVRNTIIRGAITRGGIVGIGSLLAGAHPAVAGYRALVGGIEAGRFGHELASLSDNIKDYIRLKKVGRW